MYGLDHAVLNANLPPTHLWMNMGYWEHTTDDFPRACKSLLLELLQSAGLLGIVNDEDKKTKFKAVNILDLGFGCGDQSITLHELASSTPESGGHGLVFKASRLTYTGLTLSKAQFECAQRRLRARGMLTESLPQDDNKEAEMSLNATFRIFCGDAGRPSTWSEDIHASVRSQLQDTRSTQTWILGLDTMYHFTPSREAVLKHAVTELDASFMAFDLLLGDQISLTSSLWLRIMCILMGVPFGNLLTIAEYKEMLVRAGYAMDEIEITDISKHVFAPLANYIQAQSELTKVYGMGEMGKFRKAASLFSWWSTSRTIKGCIVVVKR